MADALSRRPHFDPPENHSDIAGSTAALQTLTACASVDPHLQDISNNAVKDGEYQELLKLLAAAVTREDLPAHLKIYSDIYDDLTVIGGSLLMINSRRILVTSDP